MGITQNIGASSLIKPGVIDNAAARPASPYEGQAVFQKDTDQLLVYNGTAWVIPNSPVQNPTGLELVKTQTVGSTVSSVTVTGAFSSTYDNYKIQWSGSCSLANGNGINIQMGTTTTGYYGVMIYAGYAAGVSVVSESNVTSWTHCAGAVRNQIALSMDIYNPFRTEITSISTDLYTDFANAGKKTGWLDITTSFTAITLFAASGTLTGGTISVYGYRK